MKAILAGGLILMVALAGCLGSEDADTDVGNGGSNGGGGSDNGGGGADNGDGTATSFALSDLTQCDFSIPGGGSIPCENQFEEIQIEGRERPTTINDQMICVARDDGFAPVNWEYWIFWDPVADEFGIYYEINLPEGVSGVHGVIHQEETDVAVNWYEGPAEGWIPPIGLRDGPSFRITLYGIEYESDTPALQGGDIRSLWSLQDGSAYPLQVVSADQDYYFNNVTVSSSNEGDYYRPQNFDISGTDFNITAEYSQFYHTLSNSFGRLHRIGCGIL